MRKWEIKAGERIKDKGQKFKGSEVQGSEVQGGKAESS
jgi:hypothetical protein